MNILLDCDGVLADFVSGALKAHDRPEAHDDWVIWDYFRSWCPSEEAFWKPLRGAAFWFGLQAYPWAGELLKLFPQSAIVTAPNLDPTCIQGKLDWLRAHFGIHQDRIVLTAAKHLLAHPASLLVDDKPDNVDAFRKAGGHAVLFPQPWNQRYAESGPEAWKIVAEEVRELIATVEWYDADSF